MLLPYFFDQSRNQMVPVTTPRLDCPPRWIFLYTDRIFYCDNSSREVIKTNYDVIQGEKRICCDLLRADRRERKNSTIHKNTHCV